MNDFENKIINLSSLNASGPDPAVFLTRFRGQQEKEMIQKNELSPVSMHLHSFFLLPFLRFLSLKIIQHKIVTGMIWLMT